MKKNVFLPKLIVLGGVLATLIVVAGLVLSGHDMWMIIAHRARGLRIAAIHRARALCMTLAFRARVLLNRPKIIPDEGFTDVIFLHHSVGRGLIYQGGMRERLTAAGPRLWDHGYNHEGLTGPDGVATGYSYGIPGNNTDPDGLAHLFAQRVHSRPVNAFSALMEHKVIVFKSCFPASNITSDEQLEHYQVWYLGMRKVMDDYPDRIFIVVTPAPLNPAATTSDAAARARAFACWLQSDEYLAGHLNVFTFDLFGLLSESDPASPEVNMLRQSHREGDDSHPTAKANEEIGPVFADYIVKAVRTYEARLAEGGTGR